VRFASVFALLELEQIRLPLQQATRSRFFRVYSQGLFKQHVEAESFADILLKISSQEIGTMPFNEVCVVACDNILEDCMQKKGAIIPCWRHSQP